MTSLAAKLSPDSTALLAIDVQNDFCHSDCEIARRGADLSAVQAAVPQIEQLIGAARAAKVLVIFVQGVHIGADVSDAYLEQRSRVFPDAPPIVEDGSWGADFYRVRPEPDETVVKKHRYSAFVGTNLDTILRARRIQTLLLTGVTTEACVESTGRDGFMRDFHIVIAKDATGTHDPLEQELALKRMDRLVGTVCTTQSAIEAWQGRAIDTGARRSL